jgi:hypothetical protein
VKTSLALYAAVPPGVVTVTKYVVPAVIDGAVTVIELEAAEVTLAGTTTLLLVGVPPDSSMKLTVLRVVAFAPVTNPVPAMVTEVPPVMEPELVARPVTVGTVGDQAQLFTVIPVPQ